MTNDKYQKIFEIDGAHQSGVTCANLGPRSGNVLATGGKDRDVCLWAFSKRDPLLSVLFSWNEFQVAGGSMSGVIKIWDLKEGKVLSTFSGHRGNITCLSHNQFDTNLWASGSLDSCAKLWDVRTKQAVNSFKGHAKTICTMDFSPDGRWLVTGADDCRIKVWDLLAGKPLAELSGHSGQVTTVQFHPNEYLLASGSSDKTVRFWDLETFECVSQSQSDTQAIQCVLFHPNGTCLYSVSSAALRVIGWEPTRLYDTVPFTPVGRNNIHNSYKFVALAMIPSKQHVVSVGLPGPGNNFMVYSTDVKKLHPIVADGEIVLFDDEAAGGDNNFNKSSPGKLRRSFYDKQSSPLTDSLFKQRSTSSDDDTTSSASEQLTIYFEKSELETDVIVDYKDGFIPKRILKRSPPGTPVPSDPMDPTMGQKVPSPLPPRKSTVDTSSRRSPTATKIASSKAKATVPPISINNSNSNKTNSRTNKDGGLCKKVVHEVMPLMRVKIDEETALENFGSVPSDNLFGRTYSVSPNDFLQNSLSFPIVSSLERHSCSTPSMCVVTEDDCLSCADKGSTSMAAVLQHRVKSIAVLRSVWKTYGVRAAVDTAIRMRDTAVIVDLLNVLNFRSNLWHLDLCAMLLPRMKELLESKYDTYVHTAVSSLRLVLRDFGNVIKNGINIVPSIGVDITQEERYHKCQKCYIELSSIRNLVMNKQNHSSSTNVHTYREISLLLQLLEA